MTEEHPFTQYVRTLGRGKNSSRSLTQDEAFDAMRQIMEGQVKPEQLGAFLMLLRVKEESPEEIAGFCAAVQAQWSHALPSVAVDIDWSCYAGKRKHLPWLVLSQLLLAQLGYRQSVHGTRGHTPNRLYIEDTYEALGLPVIRSTAELADWTPDTLAFVPLSIMAPRLEEIIQLRHILGLRSPVHSFARLLNPFQATTVLQAIFHPGYHRIHQGAAAVLGYEKTLVIKGDGGEFERNPDADLTLYWAHAGETSETQLPRTFAERQGGKPQELNLDRLRGVWHGSERDVYGEEAVLSTTALALMAHEGWSWDVARERALAAWAERDKQRL